MASDRVDIYDVSSGVWTTARLSEARYNLAAAAVGNMIIFAGGATDNQISRTIDIYEVSNNTWTTAQLSKPILGFVSAAAAGNKILVSGWATDGTGLVDIFTLIK